MNDLLITSQSRSEVFGSHLSLFVWTSHRFRRSGSVGNRKNCGVGFVLELVVQFGAAHPVILVSRGERDGPTINKMFKFSFMAYGEMAYKMSSFEKDMGHFRECKMFV